MAGDDWSREEVEATVAAYLGMLELELRNLPFNKSDVRRRLMLLLAGRTEGAVERKHQNISAILHELGFTSIRGYKPLSNYQKLLVEVVQAQVNAHSLKSVMQSRAEDPIPEPPQVDGSLLNRLTERPDRPEPRRPSMLADRPRISTANFLEIEARNARLGFAGEEFAIRFEIERLRHAGQKRLADKIDHVSRTRGDGDGYDIQSFEVSGRERLIEVKTTTFGIHTPFFVTRKEVDVSFDQAEQYFVYRIFDFRHDPRLYLVPGDIGRSFSLEATTFIAR